MQLDLPARQSARQRPAACSAAHAAPAIAAGRATGSSTREACMSSVSVRRMGLMILPPGSSSTASIMRSASRQAADTVAVVATCTWVHESPQTRTCSAVEHA